MHDNRDADYAPALDAKVTEFCRQLAESPPAPWVETVSEQWPGPMAHEYHRLREVLQQGQLIPAIWQLKDLAEMLLKFPALVMARDVIAHGDAAAANEVRRSLFQGSLSFGQWIGLVRDTVAPVSQRAQKQGAPLLCPDLPALFRTDQGKQTPWLKTLSELVTWRNDTFAHGALRLDPNDFTNELRNHVGSINLALAAQVAAGVWRDARLCGDENINVDLTGWRAIRQRHRQTTAAHVEHTAPLTMVVGSRRLRLVPLVALRRCSLCPKQDVFFYDSRGGKDNSNFVLLDYLAGHRMTMPSHRVPDLADDAILPDGAPSLLRSEEVMDDQYGNRDLEDSLLEKALEARYLEPTYLRAPLQRFLETHERGVFWLTAPRDIGKSMFIRGIAQPGKVGGKPLGEDLCVQALLLRREIGHTARDLRSFLYDTVLKEGFGLSERGADFPRLDIDASDPAVECARCLQEVMRLKPSRIGRVVLCFDGLDELPEATDKSLADFLPSPNDLPVGCYLVVTSRSLAECPPQVRTVLQQRFAGATLLQQCTLRLDESYSATDPVTKGYFDLLRAYYEREVTKRRLGDIRQAFIYFLGQQTEVTCRDDLSRKLPQELLKAVREEWQELTHDRIKVRSPRGAPSLAETVVLPVVRQYEDAYRAILDKAERYFKYLAHLTGLVRNGALPLTAIADLPSGQRLYEYFLRQLQHLLVSTDTEGPAKAWEFVQRLILTLAAVEQAHAWEYQLEPAGYRTAEFLGVPLEALDELLGEPGRTYKLVFALYSVKEILAVWKGENARDASYRLGLKDFVETVARVWPHELAALHAQYVREWLTLSQAPQENADSLPAGFERILAHAALSSDAVLKAQVHTDPWLRDLSLGLGTAYHAHAQPQLALQWDSRALLVARGLASQQPTVENRNELAEALRNKSIELCIQGRLFEALELTDAAITIRQRLVMTEGHTELANSLAAALMSKGNVLLAQERLPEALAVYDDAITIRQRLVMTEGRTELTNDLAAALMNKGNALQAQGQLPEALAVYDDAITIRQRLVKTEGRIEVAYALAGALMNKGNVLQAQGRLPEALTVYDNVVAFYQLLMTTEGRTELANSLAAVLMNKGTVLQTQGRLLEALAVYDNAIAIYQPLVTTEGRSELVHELARTLMNKGNVLQAQGRLPEALTVYNDAIAIYQPLVTTEGRTELADDLAKALMNKGGVLQAQERLPEALVVIDDAIASWEQGVADERWHWVPNLVVALGNHLEVQRRQAAWEAAADDVRRILLLAEDTMQADVLTDPFQRKFVGFVQRLRKLSPDERELLYAALDEDAEVVRRLIEGEESK